jgi:hypothetical protein
MAVFVALRPALACLHGLQRKRRRRGKQRLHPLVRGLMRMRAVVAVIQRRLAPPRLADGASARSDTAAEAIHWRRMKKLLPRVLRHSFAVFVSAASRLLTDAVSVATFMLAQTVQWSRLMLTILVRRKMDCRSCPWMHLSCLKIYLATR